VLVRPDLQWVKTRRAPPGTAGHPLVKMAASPRHDAQQRVPEREDPLMTDPQHDSSHDPDADPESMNPRTGEDASPTAGQAAGSEPGADPDADPDMLNPRDTRGDGDPDDSTLGTA